MPASSSEPASVFAIEALRMSPVYHAAELSRRQKGTAALTKADEKTEEHAAIRLLIGTWDAIAGAVFNGAVSKEAVFKTQPLCHMWKELREAVMELRKTLGTEYAQDFEALSAEFDKWVKDNPSYLSRSCSGVWARFG